MKKKERKVTVKLLETEQMNTYKILAEFLAIKFNENGFDKVEQKWFNKKAARKLHYATVQVLYRKKKDIFEKISFLHFCDTIPNVWACGVAPKLYIC